ncbi:hypothetical protein JW905_00220 [bacterium]|nr:hypothetical protein [candidate division CSSED10-310 bacterium]
MSLLRAVNDDFGRILKETDPKSQHETFCAQMAEKKMFMEGKLFPSFLKPYFVEQSARPLFARVTKSLISSLNKIGDAYFQKGMFKEFIRLQGRLLDLASLDYGYPGHHIINRLDIFFIPETGELKLLEYNCGDPSGMGWHDLMLEMFLDLPVIKKMSETYDFQTDWLVKSHFKTFFKKYRQWCERKGIPALDKPTIAFVCKRDSTVLDDFMAFVGYYKEMGFDTEFGDPRDFTYDGKDLTLRGKKIHLIYRDAIDDVILDPYWEGSQQLVQALRDSAVCFINPVSAATGDFKAVLEILTNAKYDHMFTTDEQEVHRIHVPWTRTLANETTIYQEREIDMVPFIRHNQERFVLKPSDGYGGFGVMVGKVAQEKDWNALIDKALAQDINYTVQEYANIPKELFPVIENGEFKGFAPKNVNINFWSHDGEFAGAFVRAAEGAIVNVHQGGGMVPVFFVDRK